MDSREKREMCNSNDSNDSKRRKYARCATRMTRKTRNAGRIRDFEQGTRITAESEGPIETSSSSQAAGITKEMARNHQGPAYQQSIPLYRQELEWKKIGIPLSRATLASDIQSTSTRSCHGTKPSSKTANESSKLHCSRSGAFWVCQVKCVSFFRYHKRRCVTSDCWL